MRRATAWVVRSPSVARRSAATTGAVGFQRARTFGGVAEARTEMAAAKAKGRAGSATLTAKVEDVPETQASPL